MNIYYLAPLPILFVVVLLLILGIYRKRVWAIVPMVFFGLVAIAGFLHFAVHTEEPIYSEPIDMGFYYKSILSTMELDEAAEIILDEVAVSGESFDTVQSMARVKALQEDYAAATGLYAKAAVLQGDDNLLDTEEVTQVSVKSKAHLASGVVTAFMEENWGDDEIPQLGNDFQVISAEALETLILDNIKEDVDDYTDQDDFYEDLEKAVDAALCISQIYDDAVVDGVITIDEDDDEANEKAIKKCISRIEAVFTANEACQSLTLIKSNLVKGYILLDETSALVNTLSNGNVYNRILLSELYLNEVISDRDFEKESFLAAEDSTYQKVIDQVEVIVRNNLNGDDDVLDQAKDDLKTLEILRDNGVLSQLKINISALSEEIKPTEQSEFFFAQAKLDVAMDNDDSADENLEQSLANASVSSNDGLAQDLIAIKNDLESKNLTDGERQNVVASACDNLVEYALPDKREEGEVEDAFEEYVQNFVSMKKASITIGAIDTEDFKTIRVAFSVDEDIGTSAEKLKKLLTIYDCNYEITDYTLEKIAYDNAYTMLASDISGSMEGNDGYLKEAIIAFADNISDMEQVSIIGFNSEIVFQDDFTQDVSDIYDSAEKIYISGGTNIYGTIMELLEDFPQVTPTTSNVLIVMTDGLDGYEASESEIFTTLANLAEEKNATIYTFGLGLDVDQDYLSNIARACGGQYINITNSVSLGEFYTFLQNQLSNQYLLTFQAIDLNTNNRELKITQNNGSSQDTKAYTLYEDMEGAVASTVDYGICQGDIMVSNLDTKALYEGDGETAVTLIGDGFLETRTYVAKLVGTNTNVDVPVEFTSETTLELLIPANLALGTYSLNIQIDQYDFDLVDALLVLEPGGEGIVVFGEYRYMANQVSNDSATGTTVLSGNVMMNDWLQFSGDLVLYGDVEQDVQLQVVDDYGAVVRFSTTDSTGLAKALANYGVNFYVEPLRAHTISKPITNPAEGEVGTYQPAEFSGGTVTIPSVVTLDAQGLLYHDHLEYTLSGNMTLEFPEQDVVFKTDDSAFQLDMDNQIGCLINSTAIGVKLDLDNALGGEEEKIMFSNVPIYLEAFTLQLDTMANDFALDCDVALVCLPNMSIGAKLEIDDGVWQEAMLKVDKPVVAMTNPVPLTFSDFQLGMTEINATSLEEAATNGRVTAVATASLAAVSEVVPDLEWLFDDVSLVAFKDITLKMPSFTQLALDVETKVEVFGAVEIAQCELSMGEFTYENALLNIDDMETLGIRLAIGAGVDADYDDFGIKLQGASEAAISTQYTGLRYSGYYEAYFDILWEHKIQGDGDLCVAFFTNDAGKTQFSVVGKAGTDRAQFNWTKDSGVEIEF